MRLVRRLRRNGYRMVTVCTWFGHVTHRCAYFGPDPARESRQARRRRERGRAAGGHRRRKNGAFPRKGGARCAYPLHAALKMQDGMTADFGDASRPACTGGITTPQPSARSPPASAPASQPPDHQLL